jgi:hypothetical protein
MDRRGIAVHTAPVERPSTIGRLQAIVVGLPWERPDECTKIQVL